MVMLVVYLILFYFDEAEPLFSSDKLDSVEKTLITKVMVIEDYIVLTQIRKLVLRIFIAYHNKWMINSQYFLDKSSKIFKKKECTQFSKIFAKTWYEPSKLVIYCLIKHIKHFLLFFLNINT